MVYVVPMEEILNYARASVLQFHMVVNSVSIGNNIIYIYIYIYIVLVAKISITTLTLFFLDLYTYFGRNAFRGF